MDRDGSSDVSTDCSFRHTEQKGTGTPTPEWSPGHPESTFRRPTSLRRARASSWPYTLSRVRMPASRPAFPLTSIPVQVSPGPSEPTTKRSGRLKLPKSLSTRRTLHQDCPAGETTYVKQPLSPLVSPKTPFLTNTKPPDLNMGCAATSSMGNAVSLMSRTTEAAPSGMELKLAADVLYGRKFHRPEAHDPPPEERPQMLDAILNAEERLKTTSLTSIESGINEPVSDKKGSCLSLTYDIHDFDSTETIDNVPVFVTNRIQVEIKVTKKEPMDGRRFSIGSASSMADRIFESLWDRALGSTDRSAPRVSVEAKVHESHYASNQQAGATSPQTASHATYKFSRYVTSSEASLFKDIAEKGVKQRSSSKLFPDADKQAQMTSSEPSNAGIVALPRRHTHPTLQTPVTLHKPLEQAPKRAPVYTGYTLPSSEETDLKLLEPLSKAPARNPTYSEMHPFTCTTAKNASVSPHKREPVRETSNIFPNLSSDFKTQQLQQARKVIPNPTAPRASTLFRKETAEFKKPTTHATVSVLPSQSFIDLSDAQLVAARQLMILLHNSRDGGLEVRPHKQAVHSPQVSHTLNDAEVQKDRTGSELSLRFLQLDSFQQPLDQKKLPAPSTVSNLSVTEGTLPKVITAEKQPTKEDQQIASAATRPPTQLKESESTYSATHRASKPAREPNKPERCISETVNALKWDSEHKAMSSSKEQVKSTKSQPDITRKADNKICSKSHLLDEETVIQEGKPAVVGSDGFKRQVAENVEKLVNVTSTLTTPLPILASTTQKEKGVNLEKLATEQEKVALNSGTTLVDLTIIKKQPTTKPPLYSRPTSNTVTAVTDARSLKVSIQRKPADELPFWNYSHPVTSGPSALLGLKKSGGHVADFTKESRFLQEEEERANTIFEPNIARMEEQLTTNMLEESISNCKGIDKLNNSSRELDKGSDMLGGILRAPYSKPGGKPHEKDGNQKVKNDNRSKRHEKLTESRKKQYAKCETSQIARKKRENPPFQAPHALHQEDDKKSDFLSKKDSKSTKNVAKKNLVSSDETSSPDMVTLRTDEVWEEVKEKKDPTSGKSATLHKQINSEKSTKAERRKETAEKNKKDQQGTPKDKEISKTIKKTEKRIAAEKALSPDMIMLKTSEVWGEVRSNKYRDITNKKRKAGSARRKNEEKKELIDNGTKGRGEQIKNYKKETRLSRMSNRQANKKREVLAAGFLSMKDISWFTLCCLILALGLSIFLIVFTVYLVTAVCVTPKTPTSTEIPLPHPPGGCPHPPGGCYYCETDFCNKEAVYLSSLLSVTKKPCENFYSHVCETWSANNPLPIPSGAGNVLSRDTMLQESLMKKLMPLLHSMPEEGIKMAARLSNTCADRTNNKAIESAKEMFFGWSVKSWPQLISFESSDVWTFAGELVRDLNVAALCDVAVDVNPFQLDKTSIVLDQPKPLFSYHDASRNEVTDLFRRALKETMSSFAPSANDIKDEHINEVMDVFIRIGSAPATTVAPEVDSTRYVIAKLIDLDSGFKDLLSKVFNSILRTDLDMNVVLKSSKFLRNFLVSTVNELPARALANYIGFLALVHTAPFFPDNLSVLRQLFGRSVLGRTPSDVSNYSQLCLLAVERLLPDCFVKGSAKLRQTLGADVTISHWLSQLVTVFSRNLPRISWIDELSVLFVRYRLKRRPVIRFGSNLEQCSSGGPMKTFNTSKPLKFFYEVSMLKQQEQLQRILRGSADLPKRPLQSDLSTRALYDETRQLVHVPMALFNTSVPSNSTMFALHLSRFGVRFYRALVELLFQNNVYELESPLSFTDEQARKLENLLSCLELDLRQLPLSLHGSVAPNMATSRSALLLHTIAVQLAFRAFRELLHVRRIWNLDFRLKGLPDLSAEMLFFVYYALDNCESADDVYKEHSGDWLPAEYRVNMPLRHIDEFGEVFGCTKDSIMMHVTSGKCSVLTSARSIK